MRTKWLLVFTAGAAALALAPGLLRAQGPGGSPPPFGGPGRFGPGRGFRVLGVEGCLNEGRQVSPGTPGYAASVLHNHVEATLNGGPSDHSSTDLVYRDSNGVTYVQTTLPALGGSSSPRTVICINDPNLHIRLVVDPANFKARQFNLPAPPAGGRGNTWMDRGNGGQNPPSGAGTNPNPNMTVTHPAPPPALASQISSYCSDAQTTQVTRQTPGGAATSLRVYCPSLGLTLYSQNSDSHSVFTTTATITATGSQVDLSKLPVPYPLLNSFTVTVVPPRSRKGPPPPPSGSTTP